jgi:O-antigen/teichoic acid export membrane protein
MKILNKDLYWIRSGFFTLLQNLLGVFFSIGSFYILLRLLGQNEYGVWALFMVTVTILETVRGGLVQNALIKYLASEEKAEHPGIIAASFTISGLLTLFCILINLGFSELLSALWKAPELVSIFNMYCITFIISGILTQFNCILQANLKFRSIFISTFILQFSFFVYVLICYVFKFRIELINLIYMQMFNYSLAAFIAYFQVKPYLSINFKSCRNWISRLFNYGKYAFGTSISSILSVTVDQMMLGAILSPVQAGAFNVAVRLTNLLDIPTNAIAVIVFPQSAKRINTEGKEGIKYLYEKSVGTLIALLIPGILFLYLFSGFVVNLVAGANYKDTIPLLHITLLYCLFTPYGRQFGNILDSIGKTKLTFLVVLLVTTINIGLNYLFINKFGVLGAAYATLTAHIIGFGIGQSILRKELNVSIANTIVYAWRFYPEFYSKYIKKSQAD